MASAEESDSAPDPPIDTARAELQGPVPEAAVTIRNLLDAEDERIQLRAAEAILDRAGLSKAKATSTISAKREVGGEPSKFGPCSDDPLENIF